jgi:hypothetical protein
LSSFIDARVGPLIKVEIMGQKICIINSYKVANDLLNDRSAIYSDRPAMPMVNDLYASFGYIFLPVANNIFQNGLGALAA